MFLTISITIRMSQSNTIFQQDNCRNLAHFLAYTLLKPGSNAHEGNQGGPFSTD